MELRSEFKKHLGRTKEQLKRASGIFDKGAGRIFTGIARHRMEWQLNNVRRWRSESTMRETEVALYTNLVEHYFKAGDIDAKEAAGRIMFAVSFLPYRHGGNHVHRALIMLRDSGVSIDIAREQMGYNFSDSYDNMVERVYAVQPLSQPAAANS